MSAPKPSVYVFGWPSNLGGADTKLVHLLRLLHRHVQFTVIPNDRPRLQEQTWTSFLHHLGVRTASLSNLPRRLQGCALALSNHRFFTDRIAHRAKDRGLKVLWSSEMMWHHEGELDALRNGVVDQVLYVSEFQKQRLHAAASHLPSAITGNYIDPACFPFRERRHPSFTIGRLSRPAPEKYPEDFPVFYECLELPDTRFRVMAWDATLQKKYRWHRFDSRWDLLPAEAESQVAFLHSLDLFVYPLGHHFKESWGRSTVEAMLTGCIPLVPNGHHFPQLILQGDTGYLCDDFRDYHAWARELRLDYPKRQRMAARCRHHAQHHLCNAAEHRQAWLRVFA